MNTNLQYGHYLTRDGPRGRVWGGCKPPFGKFPNLSDSSCLLLFHHKKNSMLVFFHLDPPLKKCWIYPCLRMCTAISPGQWQPWTAAGDSQPTATTFTLKQWLFKPKSNFWIGFWIASLSSSRYLKVCNQSQEIQNIMTISWSPHPCTITLVEILHRILQDFLRSYKVLQDPKWK